MKLQRLMKLFILLLLVITPRMVFAGDLVIIVNAENSVSALSNKEVQRYMLKKARSWPDGQKVRSVDRKGSPSVRKAYLKGVVKKNPNQLEKYWVAQRYKSGVKVPPKFSSDQQVIEYVQSFPGAVGYVNSDSIQDDQQSSIKVVATFPLR